MWYVYIIECKNGHFYTGVTNDIARRMKAHADGTGAKYTRAFGFKKLLFKKSCRSRSSACKQEATIKKLTRPAKKALIKAKMNVKK